MDDKNVSRDKLKRLIVILFAIAAVIPLLINGYVIQTSSGYVLNESQTAGQGVDCIIVLGAGLLPDKTPNLMLKDRLDQGIRLYKNGAAPKLLLSGDNGKTGYDEVNAMKKYALLNDVPACDIFLDHAGFSTYDSMYRAKEVFQAEKIIVVTQKYHLYRAVYIARGLGIDAYGAAADPCIYAGQSFRELREILARNKDFIMTSARLSPAVSGEIVPIGGDGAASHD